MILSKDNQSGRYGEPWTRDELVLAFELYCRIPFKKTKAGTQEVRELAFLLGRSPASVARKLGNFGAFDPELRKRNITGLAHGSRLDRQIWDEFHADWSNLVFEAHQLKTTIQASNLSDDILQKPHGPSEQIRMSKQRLHQGFFRDTVLSNYEGTCCITGLNIPQCLIASHIIPWSHDCRYRVDPSNGLCLSATFDKLFDAGLIGVNEDLTICVSSGLRSSLIEVVVQLIHPYHGRSIRKPHRFMPSAKFLKWHRQNVFLESK